MSWEIPKHDKSTKKSSKEYRSNDSNVLYNPHEKKKAMAKRIDNSLVGKLKKAINSKPSDYLGKK